MRAALFHAHGDPSVLRIEDVAVPEPARDEVRLRVAASALNHLDLWVRRGLPIDTTMPHIGGSDIAGAVEAVGAGVDGWEEGARVVVNPSLWCGRCEWCLRGEQPLCVAYRIIGEHTQGGLAEFVTVPARNLYRVPDGYPLETAAAAPLVFLTAWRGLLVRGRLRAGETVLITAASGGVGTAAVQVAAHAGARVVAVSTARHVERLLELGADHVIDRTASDFSREAWALTGRRGVDVLFDSVGEATWAGALRALSRGGRLVTCGATTGAAATTDLRLLYWKQLEVLGTTMSTHAEFEAVMRLVFEGLLDPVIDVVWPLARVREAHERLEAGAHFGKVVLVPPS
jgi:NADPH:quinone reductase-like Zn-dependent oxidoreductase